MNVGVTCTYPYLQGDSTVHIAVKVGEGVRVVSRQANIVLCIAKRET